jgi:hypothetical protein
MGGTPAGEPDDSLSAERRVFDCTRHERSGHDAAPPRYLAVELCCPGEPDEHATMTIENHDVALASGTRMPLLGLGTWEVTGPTAVSTIRLALELGYRHVDTATMYANEREVGRAIAESGVPREEIFVTTKLPQGRAGRERETLEASLLALGFNAVDLWLVHWPPGAARGRTYGSGCSNCRRQASRGRSA